MLTAEGQGVLLFERESYIDWVFTFSVGMISRVYDHLNECFCLTPDESLVEEGNASGIGFEFETMHRVRKLFFFYLDGSF
jgi:hypothetical protein